MCLFQCYLPGLCQRPRVCGWKCTDEVTAAQKLCCLVAWREVYGCTRSLCQGAQDPTTSMSVGCRTVSLSLMVPMSVCLFFIYFVFTTQVSLSLSLSDSVSVSLCLSLSLSLSLFVLVISAIPFSVKTASIHHTHSHSIAKASRQCLHLKKPWCMDALSPLKKTQKIIIELQIIIIRSFIWVAVCMFDNSTAHLLQIGCLILQTLAKC